MDRASALMPGEAARICRMASAPVRSGRPRSAMTRAGAISPTKRRAVWPLFAPATTSRSGSLSTRARSPSRAIWFSSARRMRVLMLPFQSCGSVVQPAHISFSSICCLAIIYSNVKHFYHESHPRPQAPGDYFDSHLLHGLALPAGSTVEKGILAHLDDGRTQNHHENGRKDEEHHGKKNLHRQFRGFLFGFQTPLHPEKGRMGSEGLADAGAHLFRLHHQSHQGLDVLHPGALPQIPQGRRSEEHTSE